MNTLYWTIYETDQAASGQGRMEFIYCSMRDWSLTGNVGKHNSVQLRHMCHSFSHIYQRNILVFEVTNSNKST